MKYGLLILSVYSYAVGFFSTNNPSNDNPTLSMLFGGVLGTMLLIGAVAVLLSEKK